jgi:murein DD-endopeptidase MepM/ murein hydrolase activator NlpD
MPPIANTECLTPQQRAEIWSKIRMSRETLRSQGLLPPPDRRRIALFDWPLRASSALHDFDFHGISNFVDQDPDYPGEVLDYNCGTRSYDLDTGYNHQGIDVFTWPFSWYKMDNSLVEIVAAEPGTLLGTDDGNDDRSCGFGGGDWNAVYIEHADGSVAWYGHMKNGSTTTKADGSWIEAGEYIGIVGSSGNSTGPHLHLEVYDADDNLVEPFFGPCNVMNDESWWSDQRPYYFSGINALKTQDAPPEFPACPQPEVPHDRDAFAPGAQVYFYAYYRDQLQDQVTDFFVLRPDATEQWSWSASSTEPFYAASYWGWDFVLPGDAPEGVWTFRAVYEGVTYDSPFTVCANDVTGPEITCPDDISVECTTTGGTPADDPLIVAFLAGASAVDACDLTVALDNDAPDFFPYGETVVTFTATDDFGNQSSCTASVTVVDTTAPTIEVTLNRYVLWPPNHKLSTIEAEITVNDICDAAATFVLTSVSSDEPDNGLGDGDTEDDIQGVEAGTADVEFQLRSERMGGGDGRVYTIVYTASDESGNDTPVVVEVRVPHDQSGNAIAGAGFVPDGSTLDPMTAKYTLVIPSSAGFDPTQVVIDRAYVGNHVGALLPLSFDALDVNHDDRADLMLTYDTAGTLALLDASASEGTPVGMHYTDQGGVDYRVDDIFSLLQIAGTGGDPAVNLTSLRAAPNPFTSDTRLSYTVAGDGAMRVNIGIYNIAGRLIRQMANLYQSPGVYSMIWDGNTDDGRIAPAGVYFQRSLIGGKETTERIVRVR